MRSNYLRTLVAASAGASLLMGCGTRDERATTDSAGGTMAMTDSTGISTTGTMSGNATGAMDASVASFIAMVNQGEITSGRLASTKARNSDVKAYARDMVEEHQREMQELQQISNQSGWTLPDSMAMMGTSQTSSAAARNAGTAAASGNSAAAAQTGASQTGVGSAAQGGAAGATLESTMSQIQQSHQSAMQQMRRLTGAQFDRAYMDSQVAGHQQALEVLRQHANSLQNSELRTKVTAMQGAVEEHLKRAQDIARNLDGGATP